jgi:glycosidase
MQWTSGLNAGFSTNAPWLPLNNDYLRKNVETESNEPDSILSFYKKLIAFRNETPSVQSGEWIPVIKGEKGILAFYRILDGDKIFVLLNFKNRLVETFLPIPESFIVVISTHRQVGNTIKSGNESVFPFEASVFRLKS